MIEFETGRTDHRVGIDFDNTLVDTANHMAGVLRQRYPDFTPYSFEPLAPDEELPDEFQKFRMEYMREPGYIASLSLCPGAAAGLQRLNESRKSAGITGIYLITGRWEYQRFDMLDFLQANNLSDYIDDMFLRPEGIDKVSSKLGNGRRAGINYLVDDDGIQVVHFVEKGKGVVIDRAWNRWVATDPDIIRCAELIDFSTNLASCKTLEAVFAVHALGFQKDLAGYHQFIRTHLLIPTFKS